VDFFDLCGTASLQLEGQGSFSLFQRHKPATVEYLRTTLSRCCSQLSNQAGALNDEVGLMESDLGNTSVGEQLKSTDFINKRVLPDLP
jgi:hypothetical protein